MTWVFTTGNGEYTEISNEDLIETVLKQAGITTNNLEKKSGHYNLTQSGQNDSLSDLIENINSFGTNNTNRLYTYFTSPEQGGYEWYSIFASTLNESLVNIIQHISSQNLTFNPPYNRQELGLFWIGYNIISELLEWLSFRLRDKSSNSGRQRSIFRTTIALILDLSSILVAIKMRELCENEIYGRELEDREQWGFLLKDIDKQVVSQLMSVLLDTGAILDNIFGTTSSVVPTILTKIGLTGSALTNATFIRQATEGIIAYSDSKQSIGWIAWLAQEIGFFQGNEMISDILDITIPVPFDLIHNITMVMIIGNVLSSSNQ